MKVTINLCAFILSLFCIPLSFIAIAPPNFMSIFSGTIGIHPLNIVLGVTGIAFILGVIGLKDVREWKAMARSIFTILFTIALTGALMVIIFFGSLLS